MHVVTGSTIALKTARVKLDGVTATLPAIAEALKRRRGGHWQLQRMERAWYAIPENRSLGEPQDKGAKASKARREGRCDEAASECGQQTDRGQL